MVQAKVKKQMKIIIKVHKIKLIQLLMSYQETNFMIYINLKLLKNKQNFYKNLKGKTFREGY